MVGGMGGGDGAGGGGGNGVVVVVVVGILSQIKLDYTVYGIGKNNLIADVSNLSDNSHATLENGVISK